MRATATRYIRTGTGPHACPDASEYAPHDLWPARDATGTPIPSTYVCPYAYSVDLARQRKAAMARQEEADRRTRAEQIAAEQLENYAENLYPEEREEFMRNAEQWRSMIADAAFDALTEAQAPK